MAKNFQFTTPVGILVYPKLNEVDVYQPVDKKGRPNGAEKRRYITKIRFENQEDLLKMQKLLKAKAAELLPDIENPKLPIKKVKKDDDTLCLEATSGEKFRPPMFDAKNNRLPAGVIIGGGSKAKLNLSVNAYEGFGGGINLYLNAGQILELVEGGVGKSPFDEEDGFTHEEDEPKAEDGTTQKGDFNF